MKRAVKKLKKKPEIVLIDGNKLPKIDNYKLKNIIKGDEKIPAISAAPRPAALITSTSPRIEAVFTTLELLSIFDILVFSF